MTAFTDSVARLAACHKVGQPQQARTGLRAEVEGDERFRTAVANYRGNLPAPAAIFPTWAPVDTLRLVTGIIFVPIGLALEARTPVSLDLTVRPWN
jgi:hypothetical protein